MFEIDCVFMLFFGKVKEKVAHKTIARFVRRHIGLGALQNKFAVNVWGIV